MTLIHRMHRIPSHLRLGLVREVVVILSVYLIYLLVPLLHTSQIQSIASLNASRIIALEEMAGFSWEAGWQAWAMDAGRGVVLFFNGVYILGFWPALLLIVVLLSIRDWQWYRWYRNVLFLTLVLALPTFLAFPVAPPRMLPGFVDIIQVFGPSVYGSEDMATFYDTVAAMPSLHFALHRHWLFTGFRTLAGLAQRLRGLLLFRPRSGSPLKAR